MSLEENFLKYFCYSREQFVILNDELFTIEKKPSSDGNSFNIINLNYSLESSDKIKEEEEDFFNRNKTLIENDMSQHIKLKYLDALENEKQNLINLNNIYLSIQDSSLEKFIKIDVYNKFHHQSDKIQNPNLNLQFDNSIEYPTLDDLKSEKTVLSDIIQGDGLIGFGNAVFTLRKGHNKNENKGYVKYNNQIYELKDSINLKSFSKKYSDKIKEKIKNIAYQHGSKLLENMDKILQEKRKIESLINKQNINSVKKGKINFRRKSENKYEVSITLEPYIIGRENKYYHFGKVTTGMDISANGNLVQMCNYPKILTNSYNHPFVWPDMRICYAGNQNLTKKGIYANKNYNITITKERDEIANIISKALNKARQVLERGYIGKSISPVKYITAFTPIANSLHEAENYARSHNISLKRIIENPK